jgi:DNA adenine methylase
MKPFFKWIGGKRQLLSQILPHFPKQYNSYYEPFLGGGAVFFAIAGNDESIKPSSGNYFLSDLNEQLIKSFNTVKNNVDDLIISLQKMKDTYDLSEDKKTYYLNQRNKDRQNNFNELSDIEISSRFIFFVKDMF